MKALAELLASSTWYAKQRDDFGRSEKEISAAKNGKIRPITPHWKGSH